MTVILRGLATAVPETVLVQDQVRDVLVNQPDVSRLGQRILQTSFDSSGITTRHTAVTEYHAESAEREPRFYDRETGLLLNPGTGERNEVYAERADALFLTAAQKALLSCPDISPSDITHVVTVSCTGFYAPGPDLTLVTELGLAAGVQRYHLGFMGCYAAMPALRLAKQMCDADPKSVVLVVSAELCTLHMRSSNHLDTIVASSLFADGAAAGIVTARPEHRDASPALELDRFHTTVTPDGSDDMAWRIGNQGFEMTLSTYVPAIIEDNIVGALRPLLHGDDSLSAALEQERLGEAIAHWAIHPGGRGILDKVETTLRLSEAQLSPARGVLRDYGNMSSATVLFVLASILNAEGTRPGDQVTAMAFGPGLTVETALMRITG